MFINRSCFDLNEYPVEPFGIFKDVKKIVNLSCINNECNVTIEYSIDILSRIIAFWIVAIEPKFTSFSNNTKENGEFSTRVQPLSYLPETNLQQVS